MTPQAYGLRDLLTPKELQVEGERFRPYRTVAAWYVLGLVVFRRVLGLGPIGLRLTIAGLAAVAGFVGLAVSPKAELGALVAIVGSGAIVASGRLSRQGRAGAHR